MALIGKADAQTAPSSAPPGLPTAAARATSRPISAEAMAMALTYRRFDSALSDAELETIARGIDRKRGAGALLNRKGAVLKNGDEPITRFTVLSEAK